MDVHHLPPPPGTSVENPPLWYRTPDTIQFQQYGGCLSTQIQGEFFSQGELRPDRTLIKLVTDTTLTTTRSKVRIWNILTLEGEGERTFLTNPVPPPPPLGNDTYFDGITPLRVRSVYLSNTSFSLLTTQGRRGRWGRVLDCTPTPSVGPVRSRSSVLYLPLDP